MSLKRDGRDMPKQVYDIQVLQDTVRILKNGDLVYDVSIKSKSINLAELYANMKVDLNDEYAYVGGLKKFESPENDLQRIFNNIYDFLSSLLVSLDKKLKELREKQSDITF